MRSVKAREKVGGCLFQNKLSFSGDVKTSVTKRDKGVGVSKTVNKYKI